MNAQSTSPVLRLSVVAPVVLVAGVISLTLGGTLYPAYVLGALLLTIGVSLVLTHVVAHPAIARPGATILHPPGLVTIAGALAIAIGVAGGLAYSSPWFWAGVGLSIVGHAAWITRIGQTPPPADAAARRRRLALLAALATPTIAVALFVAFAIAREGDLAWDGAPLAVPGLIVAGFLAAAVIRTLRARADA